VRTTIFGCIFFILVPLAAKGEEWITPKEDSAGRVNARATVDYREETRADRQFVVLKITITTRTKGIGATGYGHGLYTMWNGDGSVFKVLEVGKHCSTGTHKERELDESKELRFAKGAFDAWFDGGGTDLLEATAEREPSSVPTTPGELADWVKNYVGPEVAKARDEVLKAPPGTVREGSNWIIRKMKKR